MRSVRGSWPSISGSSCVPSAIVDDQKRSLIDSPRLRHARTANSFFTRMIHVSRRPNSSIRVADRPGEAWCARRWQLHVRPDGFARFEGPVGSLELVLELDLGTENRGRLEDKMERYRVLAREATAPDVVLFDSRAKLAKQARVMSSAGRRCRSRLQRSAGI
jgi:hypothetical protein